MLPYNLTNKYLGVLSGVGWTRLAYCKPTKVVGPDTAHKPTNLELD